MTGLRIADTFSRNRIGGTNCKKPESGVVTSIKAHEGTLLDLGSAKAVSISPTRRSACMLLDSGQLKCFHANALTLATTPHFGAGRAVTVLAGSDNHFCAVLDDRSLKCWGSNAFAALGLGKADDYQIQSNDSSGDEVPRLDIAF